MEGKERGKWPCPDHPAPSLPPGANSPWQKTFLKTLKGEKKNKRKTETQRTEPQPVPPSITGSVVPNRDLILLHPQHPCTAKVSTGPALGICTQRPILAWTSCTSSHQPPGGGSPGPKRAPPPWLQSSCLPAHHPAVTEEDQSR